jgi:hypothetical protein
MLDGYKPITTQIFDSKGKYLDDDSVFAVKDSLLVDFVPRKGDSNAELELEYDVHMIPNDEEGESGPGLVSNGVGMPSWELDGSFVQYAAFVVCSGLELALDNITTKNINLSHPSRHVPRGGRNWGRFRRIERWNNPRPSILFHAWCNLLVAPKITSYRVLFFSTAPKASFSTKGRLQ